MAGTLFFAVKLRKSRKNSENRGKLPNFGHFPRFLRKNSAFRDFFPSKMGCVRGKNNFFFPTKSDFVALCVVTRKERPGTLFT